MGTELTLELKELAINFSLPIEELLSGETKLKKRKVLFLAGPTGSGKTALSLLIAKTLGNVEIVSADSMQVYRGMDIGTAKVSQEERNKVPHHLIDIRDVTQGFSVVDFYYEARGAIESILAVGHVPLVVGGAGFYFHSLLYGPPDGPPSVPQVRQALEEEAERSGLHMLYNRLIQQDPQYAATITFGDRHKIIRALEIITLTGQPVSRFSWRCRHPCLDYDFHSWFVYRPRETLYRILEHRCEKMIADGLIDETAALKKKGLESNPSAAQAIGYRQALTFLQSAQTEKNFLEFQNTFKISSRHYAKKQFTWFRKEPSFRWLNVELHDFETAMDMIVQDYVREE